MVLDEPKDDDASVEQDGLTFLISKPLAQKSGLVTIDFIAEGWQQGFRLSSENPLESGADPAGCGGSCNC